MTLNIGDETYIPALKLLVKADQQLIEVIKDYEKINTNLNEIKTDIDLYYGNLTMPEKEEIKENLILQISKFNDIEGIYDYLDPPSDSEKKNIIFDDYLRIYNATIGKYQDETDINRLVIIAHNNDIFKQLQKDLIQFKEPDMTNFIKYMQEDFNKTLNKNYDDFLNTIKDKIDEIKEKSDNDKTNSAAPAASGTKQQTINVLDTADIEKLDTCLESLGKIETIINKYKVGSGDPIIYDLDINTHINTFKELIKYLSEINKAHTIMKNYIKTKKMRLNLDTTNIEGIETDMNTFFIKKISDDLFDFFNTTVLYYNALMYNPNGDQPYAANLRDSIKKLIEIPNLDNYFKHVYPKLRDQQLKHVKLNMFHKEIQEELSNYRKLKTIIENNIKDIYKIKPVNLPNVTDQYIQELDISQELKSRNILFKPNILTPVGTGSRRSINTTMPTEDELPQHYIWYKDQNILNRLYTKIIRFDRESQDISGILHRDSKAIIRDVFNKPHHSSNDLNDYFKDLAFIMNLQLVLKKFLETNYKYIYDISNIIDINKTLTINSFLQQDKKKHYYNNDKYKLITVFGAYIKNMGSVKLKNLLTLNSPNNKYGFSKIFKQQLLPNPDVQFNTISKTFDMLTNFTKSTYDNQQTATIQLEDFESTYKTFAANKKEIIQLAHNADIQEYYKYIQDNYIITPGNLVEIRDALMQAQEEAAEEAAADAAAPAEAMQAEQAEQAAPAEAMHTEQAEQTAPTEAMQAEQAEQAEAAQAAPTEELPATQPYDSDMHSPRRSPQPRQPPQPRRIRSLNRSLSLPTRSQLLPQSSPSPKQRRRKRSDFSLSPSSTEKQLQQSSVNPNSAYRMEDNENTGVAAAPGLFQSMTTFFSSLFGPSKKQKK